MGSFRAAAFALILAPALSAAQPSAPSAKDKQQASDLVKRAIAKSQAGNHDEAVTLYLDAYKIIPQPLLLSNIGSEYQQMKKPVEALKYFCRYLAEDPIGSNSTYATAQARTLYIELGGVPDVPDDELCKPLKKPAPPPPPTDTTNTTTTMTVDTSPPQQGPIDEPTSSQSPLRYIGLGLGVVGAGVFGLGVYYGLEAKKISDEITNHDPADPWPSDIKAREAEGESAETKQIGFMIGGGAAIAAGVAMFFLAPSKSSGERAVAVTPLVTGETLGVAAGGRF